MRGGDEAIGNLIVAGCLAIGFIPIILALRFYFKDTAEEECAKRRERYTLRREERCFKLKKKKSFVAKSER